MSTDSHTDLTATQRHSLDQLRELTNGADDEVSIGVLRSVEWDVQKAAELIFEGGVLNNPSSSDTAPTTRTSSTSAREEFEFDESETAPLVDRGSVHRHLPPPRPFLSFLSLPFTLITSLFRFVFHILRFPFTFIRLTGRSPRYGFLGLGLGLGLGSAGSFGGRGGRGGRAGGVQGSSGVEKWVRELEEETGAVCWGGVKNTSASASGTTTGANTSDASTSLNARPSTTNGSAKTSIDFTDSSRKYLPDFQLCTYEDLLKTCQKDMKIGCVILVSEEHDDVGEFKRSTLTDPTFLKTLHENDILVWGGDVRDREAWSASEKLQATTYPFVAFIALQPRRDPGSSSSTRSSPPVLTVLSRHQGPSYASSSSSSAPTSAQTLTTHLQTSLLPRIQPYLTRLHSQQTQRERDRQLRLEQDRQYAESMRRDRERIEGAMRREREEREAREREAREAREREAREIRERREEEERRVKAGVRRENVKKWVGRWVGAKKGQGAMRIAIRLPSGNRVIEVFDKDEATVTGFYARVEALLGGEVNALANGDVEVRDERGNIVLGPMTTQKDAENALDGYILSCIPSNEGPLSALSAYTYPTAQAFWGFTIATSYPRVEIPWEARRKLGDIGDLKGGGQVVVELVSSGLEGNGGRRSVESGRKSIENGQNDQAKAGEESDGYETESSNDE